jgi:hypothetical protein
MVSTRYIELRLIIDVLRKPMIASIMLATHGGIIPKNNVGVIPKLNMRLPIMAKPITLPNQNVFWNSDNPMPNLSAGTRSVTNAAPILLLVKAAANKADDSQNNHKDLDKASTNEQSTKDK